MDATGLYAPAPVTGDTPGSLLRSSGRGPASDPAPKEETSKAREKADEHRRRPPRAHHQVEEEATNITCGVCAGAGLTVCLEQQPAAPQNPETGSSGEYGEPGRPRGQRASVRCTRGEPVDTRPDRGEHELWDVLPHALRVRMDRRAEPRASPSESGQVRCEQETAQRSGSGHRKTPGTDPTNSCTARTADSGIFA